MTILTKASILAANDLPRELVAVPEWGGEIFVRGMTGKERDQFESEIVVTRKNSQSVDMTNIRAKLAALCICDEQGERLFTESDVRALSGKSASALQRVFIVAQRLSGIGEADVKELTGEMTENPTADSPTD